MSLSFHRRRLRHLLLSYPVCHYNPHSEPKLAKSMTAAAVGTVQIRSLIEPLRKVVARVHGHYICGKAVDLVMGERLLEVELKDTDGAKRNIYVP